MEPQRGDWIRCVRDQEKYPSKGTWPRYDGRTGRIITINNVDKEYGVRFTASNTESTTWFLPHELVVISRPPGSPNIRVQDLATNLQEG